MLALTHPGLVKCSVLQPQQASGVALTTRQRRGRGGGGGGAGGQQDGALGDHGGGRGGAERSRQSEALKLSLSLLLQHLVHHHLLLLQGPVGGAGEHCDMN